jgi:DNA/RNA-binding domain of Phe-tRNA-synthetase-like protein
MTTRKLSLEDIAGRFPDFRVTAVTVALDAMAQARSETLAAEVARREARARERWAGVELSAIPGVAAWRTAYKGFGIKRTSYRSSAERLIKRVQAGEALPAINPLVDIYNAVSLTHGFCLGADDLDKTSGDLAFRFSRPGDSFLDMGAAQGEDPNDPPKEGEVVYADANHVLCRRWNWRQDARSAVTPASRRVLITVQANGWGDPEAAAADLIDWIGRELGGRCAAQTADRLRPQIALPDPSAP